MAFVIPYLAGAAVGSVLTATGLYYSGSPPKEPAIEMQPSDKDKKDEKDENEELVQEPEKRDEVAVVNFKRVIDELPVEFLKRKDHFVKNKRAKSRRVDDFPVKLRNKFAMLSSYEKMDEI